MRWLLRLAQFNFPAQHKKVPRDVDVDALLRTDAATTLHDWDEIPSSLMETPSNSSDNLCPEKRSYARAAPARATRWYSSQDDLNLDDLIPDELFGTLLDPTPADPNFEPILVKWHAVAQFHDALCVEMWRCTCQGVMLSFEENKNELLWLKVPPIKSFFLMLLDNAYCIATTMLA